MGVFSKLYITFSSCRRVNVEFFLNSIDEWNDFQFQRSNGLNNRKYDWISYFFFTNIIAATAFHIFLSNYKSIGSYLVWITLKESRPFFKQKIVWQEILLAYLLHMVIQTK